MEGRCHMIASELEAAEALASFAQGSSRDLFNRLETVDYNTSKNPVQDHRKSAQMIPDCSTSASHQRAPQLVPKAPVNWCNKNSTSRAGRRLRSAEQEVRRMRRVLANRESARQTIIRRQAMFQELFRKASELSEENGNLKKIRKLALKHLDSLKDRNVHLKAKLAELKKTQSSQKRENLKVPAAASSASSFPSNQPSGVSFYRPSPLQFPITPTSGIRNPRATPLVFLPVPFLPPFVAFDCGKHPPQDTHPPKEDPRPWACDSQMKVGEVATASTPLVTTYGSPSGSGSCQSRGNGDSVHNISTAATEARWRRRELMKMRHHPHTLA